MPYIHEIIFISAFFVLLVFSYAVGVGEKNKDKPLKDASGTIMGISLATMLIVWLVKWKTQLPGNTGDFLYVWDSISK